MALVLEMKKGLCINLGWSNIAWIISFFDNNLGSNNSFQIFSCFLIKLIGFSPDLSIKISISLFDNLFFKYKFY